MQAKRIASNGPLTVSRALIGHGLWPADFCRLLIRACTGICLNERERAPHTRLTDTETS